RARRRPRRGGVARPAPPRRAPRPARVGRHPAGRRRRRPGARGRPHRGGHAGWRLHRQLAGRRAPRAGAARLPGGAGRGGGDGGRRLRPAGELHPRRRPRRDGGRDDRAGARIMTRAERLRAPDPEICRAAIAELVERGRATPEELAALADCLGAGRKVVERPAAEAFAALAARGAPVEDVLLAALASPLPRRRWGAAFALSLVGNPPAATLPVLLETLGDDDGDLRWAAAASGARRCWRRCTRRAPAPTARSGARRRGRSASSGASNISGRARPRARCRAPGWARR